MKRRAFMSLLMLVVIGHGIWAAQATELIASADQRYDRWSQAFDYDAYQDDLECAIDLYEQALATLPQGDTKARFALLVRLSRAYFELAEGYFADYGDAEELYSHGKDYALMALRLDPEFASIEKTSFRAALSSAADVEAIFWYGNTLGRFLEFHRFTAMRGGVRDVHACFERAVELDSTYMEGGPLRSLASFYAQVPGFLGGDMSRAETLFQQALAVGPTFLENRVNWAEFVLKPRRDWPILCDAVSIVTAQAEDLTTMSTWPLYNRLALQRAQALQEETGCEP